MGRKITENQVKYLVGSVTVALVECASRDATEEHTSNSGVGVPTGVYKIR